MEQHDIDRFEREKEIEKRLSLIEEKLKVLGVDEEYEAKLKELAGSKEEEKPLEEELHAPQVDVTETVPPSGSPDETPADDKAGQQ